MSIARTSILRGPCKVTFAGGTFFSKGDVNVAITEETFQIATSAHGIVDERFADRMVKVEFEPAGEWENLSILWPYGSTVIGTSIFTGSDRPLVCQSITDGRTLTLKAAAVTKMPSLVLSATKTLIGSVEFTGIGADNTAWTVADSLVADAAGTYSDATFSPTSILTKPFTLAWGAAPWDNFKSFDGVNVEFNLSLSPLNTDDCGLVDMMFSSLSVSCSLIPITAAGLTVANVLAALVIQGSGAVRGSSLNQRSNTADLVCTGTGGSPVVTIKKAAMKEASLKYSATAPQIQTVQFVATRTFSSGVGDPLFTLA